MSVEPEIRGVLQARIALRLRDLSHGGAAIVASTLLPQGTVHEFMLDLGGEAFVSRARVRRCQHSQHGADHDVGIEFTEMEPRDAARLRNYLRARWGTGDR